MLKKELEKNEQEKNKKREEGQAVSNVKLEKVKQISKIMLSIDHLEYFCKYKNLKNKLEKNEKIIMQYDAIKGNDHFKLIQNNFDDYTGRLDYSLQQLTSIQ